MLRARSWVRRLSTGALLLTVLMVGTCSATGLYTTRGIGAELIRRDPASYLSTIAILAGPLLVLQALPVLLTIGRISRRRAFLVLAAIIAAAAGSLVTAYAAFVASLARLCVGGVPTPAQDAACAAGTGALAGFFGIAALAALPFAAALWRDANGGREGGH
jgi:hypothetical protein